MLKFEDVQKLEPGDMIQFEKSTKTWIVQTATFIPGTQKFKVFLGDPDNPANGTYFTEKQLAIANWVKEDEHEHPFPSKRNIQDMCKDAGVVIKQLTFSRPLNTSDDHYSWNEVQEAVFQAHTKLAENTEKQAVVELQVENSEAIQPTPEESPVGTAEAVTGESPAMDPPAGTPAAKTPSKRQIARDAAKRAKL